MFGIQLKLAGSHRSTNVSLRTYKSGNMAISKDSYFVFLYVPFRTSQRSKITSLQVSLRDDLLNPAQSLLSPSTPSSFYN